MREQNSENSRYPKDRKMVGGQFGTPRLSQMRQQWFCHPVAKITIGSRAIKINLDWQP